MAEASSTRPDAALRLPIDDPAWRCARESGVTRLAELTRLDVLGLPTFQAVRPWSRALSVHQGKGSCRLQAQRSALMEAVESDAAERFAGERVRAAAAALPGDARPRLDDYLVRRDAAAPDMVLDWTPARRWRDGGPAWMPWLHVSLDFTCDYASPIERSSNGLAAHFDPEQAREAALCEVLERDAVCTWLDLSEERRALDRLGLDEAPPWLTALKGRCGAAGISLHLFGLRALGGWPVVVCVLDEPAALNPRRVRVWGSACRPTTEPALLAAVAEAAQSRLTIISAARDDILPEDPPRRPDGYGFAPPLPPSLPACPLSRFCAADAAQPPDASAMAGVLEEQGVGPVVEVVLDTPAPAFAVKVAAPGLAMLERRRRQL